MGYVCECTSSPWAGDAIVRYEGIEDGIAKQSKTINGQMSSGP